MMPTQYPPAPHQPPPTKVHPVWIILAVVFGIVFVFSLIIWLGSARTDDGDPIIQDAGPILTAVVSGLFALAAVIIPILLKIRSSTSKTEEHVVNSHGSTILRDDIDELKRGISSIITVQRQQGKDILGIRDELGSLRQTDRQQWEALEDTAAMIRRKKEND